MGAAMFIPFHAAASHSVALPSSRGQAMPAAGMVLSVGRLLTDPLYYMTLTLNNIVVGSRYRVTRASDGLELATGVAAATDEVIAGVPVYSTGMLVNIAVRRGTTAPKYKPFDTAAIAAKAGASAYIAQVPDPIA